VTIREIREIRVVPPGLRDYGGCRVAERFGAAPAAEKKTRDETPKEIGLSAKRNPAIKQSQPRHNDL
jgi:hypothetical protein